MPFAEEASGRWRMLAVIGCAELLGMSLWFAATAIAPELSTRWSLSPAEAGWLTSAVQLGFVAGTLAAAVLNLADIVPSRTYFAASAAFAALANLGMLAVGSFAAALVLRFLTGALLAGVYPPAMKMAATWFRRRRGLAIGVIVGALTVGKALPYLIDALGGAEARSVIVTTSAMALVAGLLVFAIYREGPHGFPRRPFSWRLTGEVVRSRPVRLVTASYLGHMWELYCFWTWIATFLAASTAARAAAGGAALSAGSVRALAFAVIATGGIACVAGGWIADRFGRERLVIGALALSGSCALGIGLAFAQSLWLLVPVALVWGMAVIADSAQFSALVTEEAPPHAVGTALTLQLSLGFLLTTVTIQLVPRIAGQTGWQWAFPVLALGPAFGILAMRSFRQLRRSAAQATAGA
ncbi:MAG TPA: MFS transporter [Gemmatimonadales bacterium]|nr:MFS transporter [Gemmatimonadales bacterium]